MMDSFRERLIEQLNRRITKQARATMEELELTQAEVATWLGITQPALNEKLKGDTGWAVVDLVILAEKTEKPIGHFLPGFELKPFGEQEQEVVLLFRKLDEKGKELLLDFTHLLLHHQES